ncbi:Scr1 family TA system antitoxin-like transcriptional regulator [Amycolatopsis sp. NPDC059027]|uniref:helix-turn-helix domain-containing protein n=1 Tax=unclassified Amycolatopsis TaxID=2618356 RepID=UPI00366AB3E7
MAGSNSGSPAAELGAALKAVREARKLTQRSMALAIGRKESDSGLLSRWEKGERIPKPEEVDAIVKALDLDEATATELAELLAAATSEGQGGQWLAVTLPERRQQLNAMLAFEHTATKVTQVTPLLIPGVLQTSDVIREIMRKGKLPEHEIVERVAMRIGRRELITRRNPAHLEVLLGESAIRYVIGGREIWADQLRYLLEMTELPNVEVRLVPYSAGWSPVLSGPFIIVDSDVRESIVHVETQRSGLILKDADDVAAHRREADGAKEAALEPAATVDYINKVINEVESQK